MGFRKKHREKHETFQSCEKPFSIFLLIPNQKYDIQNQSISYLHSSLHYLRSLPFQEDREQVSRLSLNSC